MPLQRAHCPFSPIPSPYLSDFSDRYFLSRPFLPFHLSSHCTVSIASFKLCRLTWARSVVMFLPIMTPSLCFLQVEFTHCLAMKGHKFGKKKDKPQTPSLDTTLCGYCFVHCLQTMKCQFATLVIEILPMQTFALQLFFSL